MRKFTEKFIAWCSDDSAAARFERTVAQGIIGVAVGVVAAYCANDGMLGTIVAPTVMAILSPIQAAIGNMGNPTIQ